MVERAAGQQSSRGITPRRSLILDKDKQMQVSAVLDAIKSSRENVESLADKVQQ